ncbi:hypothetical protein BJ912DRAFT_945869 [Pholiota molesta]|nr:hypothetical protein BJ912DRAFT_945869 [Pholiota molesta]
MSSKHIWLCSICQWQISIQAGGYVIFLIFCFALSSLRMCPHNLEDITLLNRVRILGFSLAIHHKTFNLVQDIKVNTNRIRLSTNKIKLNIKVHHRCNMASSVELRALIAAMTCVYMHLYPFYFRPMYYFLWTMLTLQSDFSSISSIDM